MPWTAPSASASTMKARSALERGVVQVAGCQEIEHRGPDGGVRIVLVRHDVGPRRRETAALDPLERQGVAIDTERIGAPATASRSAPTSTKRAEQHVAGDPAAQLT